MDDSRRSILEISRKYKDVPLRRCDKSSTAVYAQHLINASSASSSFHNPCDLILDDGLQLSTTKPRDYSITEVIGDPPVQSHKGVCDQLTTWLNRHIRCCNNRKDIISKAEREVNLSRFTRNQSFLTKTKLVDVAINSSISDACVPAVQFEIESKRSRETTLWKLKGQLVDQLRYYMNRGICGEVAGFYVPVSEGCIEKVTCCWNDNQLRYNCYSEALDKSSVIPTIKAVAKYQCDIDTSGVGNDFYIPVPETFVTAHFGQEAKQVTSGYSVVVKAKDAYYKFVYGKNATDFLFSTLTCNPIQLDYSCIPIGLDFYGAHNVFFKFKPLKKPLLPHEAHIVIRTLVSDVHEAISELHGKGFAHCDIRLKNICFNDFGHAVLIDLDRCCEVDLKPIRHGNSTMYEMPLPTIWTAGKLDWKQLSIMVQYIMKPSRDYHTIEVSAKDHPFLYTMFIKGKTIHMPHVGCVCLA